MAKKKESKAVTAPPQDKFSALSKADLALFFRKTLRTIENWQKIPGNEMPKMFSGSGIANNYDLRECVLWAVKAGVWGGLKVEGETLEGLAPLEAEKYRLTKEQADHAALKNAQLRRELIPVVELQATWEKVVINARAKLLLIPQKAHALAGLDEKELKKVTAGWIEEALLELSRGSESSFEADGAAAEADN